MIATVSGTALVLVIVATGGGVGCAARAAVREALAARGVSASTAILGVNLLGAALAGAALGAVPDPGSTVRGAVLAVLSGWTTYSAFSTDVFAALRDRRFGRAATLWIGTIVATPALALLSARLAAEVVR